MHEQGPDSPQFLCLRCRCRGGGTGGAARWPQADRHGWTAYSYAENGQPVCYVAAAPAKSDGKYTKRGDVFMLITHRPSQKSLDVVSFVAGYPFKPESQAELTVGKDKFMLFVKEERAWAPDDKADSTIVRGTSSRGTATVDHFSLKGFARAYDAINKACKVKR